MLLMMCRSTSAISLLVPNYRITLTCHLAIKHIYLDHVVNRLADSREIPRHGQCRQRVGYVRVCFCQYRSSTCTIHRIHRNNFNYIPDKSGGHIQAWGPSASGPSTQTIPPTTHIPSTYTIVTPDGFVSKFVSSRKARYEYGMLQ